METQQALWATCANLFDHPHSKKVPDYVKMDFPVFLFVHVASCPVILNHCKQSLHHPRGPLLCKLLGLLATHCCLCLNLKLLKKKKSSDS